MIEKIKAGDITKEKCLWDVYLLACKIKMSTSTLCSLLSVFILLFSNSFFLEKDSNVLITDIRNWSSLGFNFTVTTLGFLIAGFTIFATLSKPDMFLTMMAYEHPETKMPVLKYNFVSFMKVFIAFIFCTFLYLFVILFCQPKGVGSNVFKILPLTTEIKNGIISFTYCIIGSSIVYLLLVLKTFIFNIYAFIMNTIRWEYHI
ncbi:hypothetical protein, partial [Enterobacter cloacae complex sp. P16RS2]|uniref:hypothetical protein n=1 Tax=Enterobacter cloacae complex sp. P16RS2 TaxID=2779577 RepID=UPI0018740EA2